MSDVDEASFDMFWLAPTMFFSVLTAHHKIRYARLLRIIVWLLFFDLLDIKTVARLFFAKHDVIFLDVVMPRDGGEGALISYKPLRIQRPAVAALHHPHNFSLLECRPHSAVARLPPQQCRSIVACSNLKRAQKVCNVLARQPPTKHLFFLFDTALHRLDITQFKAEERASSRCFSPGRKEDATSIGIRNSTSTLVQLPQYLTSTRRPKIC